MFTDHLDVTSYDQIRSFLKEIDSNKEFIVLDGFNLVVPIMQDERSSKSLRLRGAIIAS